MKTMRLLVVTCLLAAVTAELSKETQRRRLQGNTCDACCDNSAYNTFKACKNNGGKWDPKQKQQQGGGGDGGNSNGGNARPCNKCKTQISIAEFAFDGASETVMVGDCVCWTNDGSMGHSVQTAEDTDAFSSGEPTGLGSGDTFVWTPTARNIGDHSYYCGQHKSMQGTLTVTAKGGGGGAGGGNKPGGDGKKPGGDGKKTGGDGDKPGPKAPKGSCQNKKGEKFAVEGKTHPGPVACKGAGGTWVPNKGVKPKGTCTEELDEGVNMNRVNCVAAGGKFTPPEKPSGGGGNSGGGGGDKPKKPKCGPKGKCVDADGADVAARTKKLCLADKANPNKTNKWVKDKEAEACEGGNKGGKGGGGGGDKPKPPPKKKPAGKCYDAEENWVEEAANLPKCIKLGEGYTFKKAEGGCKDENDKWVMAITEAECTANADTNTWTPKAAPDNGGGDNGGDNGGGDTGGGGGGDEKPKWWCKSKKDGAKIAGPKGNKGCQAKGGKWTKEVMEAEE